MELSKALPVSRLRVPLTATDKLGVITELIDMLAAEPGLIDRERALAAVLKRESERTTGIGYGLAIPHGKSDGCKQLAMVAGKPATPIDFQSYDGRPVNFVVMLVSPPDQTSAHIQALAKISKLMNIEIFRDAVAAASTAQELHDAIVKGEAAAE